MDLLCEQMCVCVCVLPSVLCVFAALRLDQCVHGSLQELLTEAAVQLRDGIR